MQENSRALELQLSHSERLPEKDNESGRLLEKLSAELHRLRQELAGVTGQADGLPVVVDDGQARQALEGLQILLAQDDTRANDLFVESEMLLRGTYGEEMQQLGRYIEAFDYSAAQEFLAGVHGELVVRRQSTS